MEIVETEVEHISLSGKTAWEKLTDWDTGELVSGLTCIDKIFVCDWDESQTGPFVVCLVG